MSTFPRRAEPSDFPPGCNVFDINLRYKLEHAWIKRYVEEAADANARAGARSTATQWSSLQKEIAANYVSKDTRIDQRIFTSAASGELERECPPAKNVLAMRIAFFVALAAETAVLAAQQVLATDFNPFVLVLAALLGVGGFLQGKGLGRQLFLRWRRRTGRGLQDDGAPEWMSIALGSALILLIAGLRGTPGDDNDGGLAAFMVTLLFAEAVAVCEALAVSQENQRLEVLREMGHAQLWAASSRHERALTQGEYQIYYEQALEQCRHHGSDGLLYQFPSAAAFSTPRGQQP
jgi:hypothetical protein